MRTNLESRSGFVSGPARGPACSPPKMMEMKGKKAGRQRLPQPQLSRLGLLENSNQNQAFNHSAPGEPQERGSIFNQSLFSLLVACSIAKTHYSQSHHRRVSLVSFHPRFDVLDDLE